MADIFYNPEEKQEREYTDNTDAVEWYKGQYGHDEPEPCLFSFSRDVLKQRSERRKSIADLYYRHLKYLRDKAKGIEL